MEHRIEKFQKTAQHQINLAIQTPQPAAGWPEEPWWVEKNHSVGVQVMPQFI